MSSHQGERSARSIGLWIRIFAVAIFSTWTFLLVTVLVHSLRTSWPDHLFEADFVSFWTGASLVRDQAGPALYDMGLQRDFQVHLRNDLSTVESTREITGHNPFHNPAPMALIFIPLTLLPMPLAYLLWSAVTVVTLLVSLNLHLRGLGRQAFSLLLLPGIIVTLVEGQANAIFVLCLSIGLDRLARDKPFAGGLALGLLWLKPQYALVIAIVFLAKARWRELGGMAATGAVVAVLFWLMTGLEGIQQYLIVLSRIGDFHPPIGSKVNAEMMMNWRGLLLNLFPGLSNSWGGGLVMLLGGGAVALLAPIWRGRWDAQSARFSVQVLTTLMVTLIAVPHSHFHGTVLLLPAVAMSMARWGEIRSWLGEWPPYFALGGYLLTLIIWPVRALSWALAIYFIVFIVAVALSFRKPASPVTSLAEKTGSGLEAGALM